MSEDVRRAKRALRQKISRVLASLTLEEKEKAAIEVMRRLRHAPPWQAAQSVLLFHPFGDEINITPLLHTALQTGKVLHLPRYLEGRDAYSIHRVGNLERDLERGHYGIMEPSAHCPRAVGNRLDFILVPGLGFDSRGRRLGRGKGYYDRLLKEWTGATCGIGYDHQLCDAVPAEPHDEILKYIVTPSAWLDTRAPDG